MPYAKGTIRFNNFEAFGIYGDLCKHLGIYSSTCTCRIQTILIGTRTHTRTHTHARTHTHTHTHTGQRVPQQGSLHQTLSNVGWNNTDCYDFTKEIVLYVPIVRCRIGNYCHQGLWTI